MPINDKEQIVTSLKVDPALWKQAKIAALECDITLGELIDQAVRDWIEKQEKEQADEHKLRAKSRKE
jgi:hypothetical protein